MSYKDNCKKENTPWIPPTPQEFTNAVEKALAQCRQKEGKTPTEPGTHNAGGRRITAAAAVLVLLLLTAATVLLGRSQNSRALANQVQEKCYDLTEGWALSSELMKLVKRTLPEGSFEELWLLEVLEVSPGQSAGEADKKAAGYALLQYDFSQSAPVLYRFETDAANTHILGVEAVARYSEELAVAQPVMPKSYMFLGAGQQTLCGFEETDMYKDWKLTFTAQLTKEEAQKVLQNSAYAYAFSIWSFAWAPSMTEGVMLLDAEGRELLPQAPEVTGRRTADEVFCIRVDGQVYSVQAGQEIASDGMQNDPAARAKAFIAREAAAQEPRYPEVQIVTGLTSKLTLEGRDGVLLTRMLVLNEDLEVVEQQPATVEELLEPTCGSFWVYLEYTVLSENGQSRAMETCFHLERGVRAMPTPQPDRTGT